MQARAGVAAPVRGGPGPARRSTQAQATLEREVIYGRSQEHLRVFVSSRMGTTLDDERRVAVSTINTFSHRRAWSWEDDAPAGAYHSEAECVGIARASDELVLILGEDLSPVTRAEYEAARDNGVQRYILIREPVTDDEAVREFITQERRHAVTRGYRNIEEFNSLLFKALNDATVRASREQMLRRRSVQLGPVER